MDWSSIPDWAMSVSLFAIGTSAAYWFQKSTNRDYQRLKDKHSNDLRMTEAILATELDRTRRFTPLVGSEKDVDLEGALKKTREHLSTLASGALGTRETRKAVVVVLSDVPRISEILEKYNIPRDKSWMTSLKAGDEGRSLS